MRKIYSPLNYFFVRNHFSKLASSYSADNIVIFHKTKNLLGFFYFFEQKQRASEDALAKGMWIRMALRRATATEMTP